MVLPQDPSTRSGEVPRLVQQRVCVHGVGAVDELELQEGRQGALQDGLLPLERA